MKERIGLDRRADRLFVNTFPSRVLQTTVSYLIHYRSAYPSSTMSAAGARASPISRQRICQVYTMAEHPDPACLHMIIILHATRIPTLFNQTPENTSSETPKAQSFHLIIPNPTPTTAAQSTPRPQKRPAHHDILPSPLLHLPNPNPNTST